MKRHLLLVLVIALSVSDIDAKLPAYQIFNSKGKKVSYSKMEKELSNAEVVLFGEYHDNPIAHWLQLELTKSLYERKGENLVLAAEMFEADNQLIFDEYLEGKISETRFEAEMRLWNNYKTDYKPLVKLAKENNLKFVASNIPRRYAGMVVTGGFEILETLTEVAKGFIAPLPVAYDPELPGYKKMLDMGGMGKGQVNENFPKAQAIKDATMAHFILQNWEPGKQVIHYHGTYHSDFYEGIFWYLKQSEPTLNIKTIATVTQEDVLELSEESFGRADFIIVVPQSMTRTY
jgi:uncharacterized iron-regulated protein